MATGPVFIPDKTPDLRTCSRTRWGNGVDVLASNKNVMLVAIADDDDSGSYVATAEQIANNSWTVRLHHINGSGVADAVTILVQAGGVWYFSVKVVPSSNGSCIVVWTHPTYGAHMLAQRFDRTCTAVWLAPVQLAAPAGGFSAMDAKPDGSGGAIVAFNRPHRNGTNRADFRVQRIDSAGALQWGNDGTQVTGTTANVPDYPVALAVGSSAVGVVWQTFAGNAPMPVSGAWLDMAGQLTTAPFVIDTVLETWGDLAVRRAVADPADGMYVGISKFTAALKVLRFDANSSSPAWTHTGVTLADVSAYALASDGANGVLIASVSTAGKIGIQRRTPQGIGIYSNSAASALATISTTQVPSASSWAWSRVLTVGSRNLGGAMVTFQDWASGTSRLMSWCCDTYGAAVAQPLAIGGGAGEQTQALMSLSQLDSVNLVWLGAGGVSGSVVTAQKLGCCPPNVPDGRFVERFPPIKCGIPFDFPTRLPGGFNVLLTCGGRNWRGGLLPLPFLYGAPGINLPGALGTHGVPAPRWVRLSLRGVAPNVRVELRSHKNDKVATGELMVGPDLAASSLLTLSFKPNAKLSYILIFTASGKNLEIEPFQVAMQVEFGDGKMPPFLPPFLPEVGVPLPPVKKPKKSKKRKS